MNIYVGNLNIQTTEQQLQNLFAPFGEVKSVKIITDNYTNHSRGFGFVEMPEKSDAEKAIDSLNNTTFDQQPIVVNEARPKTNNSGGNFNRKRY